jgi:hypothetical protein
MSLLDSETHAMMQLKQAAGLQRGLLSQLPMEDKQADSVFRMLDAQISTS